MATLGYTDLTIPAGKTIRQPISGRYLRCVSVTNNFSIRLNGNEKLATAKNFIIEEENFNLVEFINETASDIVVEYWYGDGKVTIDDKNLTAEITPASTVTDAADTTITGAAAAVTIVAQDIDRKKVTIQADPDNTGVIRIGNAPDATHGLKLDAGQSIEYTNTAELKAYSPSGDQVVIVQEEG